MGISTERLLARIVGCWPIYGEAAGSSAMSGEEFTKLVGIRVGGHLGFDAQISRSTTIIESLSRSLQSMANQRRSARSLGKVLLLSFSRAPLRSKSVQLSSKGMVAP